MQSLFVSYLTLKEGDLAYLSNLNIVVKVNHFAAVMRPSTATHKAIFVTQLRYFATFQVF